MNIDRYMVNLFFEIKRNLPNTKREPLKISNPDLGNALIELYHTIDDDAVKRLIEVFLERAKEDWSKNLKPTSTPEFALYKKNTPQTTTSDSTNVAKPQPKTRYYRGVPIDI